VINIVTGDIKTGSAGALVGSGTYGPFSFEMPRKSAGSGSS
jgi:hypothetical protein